jgi:hypothetical protein
MNLNENIKRIKSLMGVEKLIPAKTNKFVFHKSNPIFRDKIDKVGLIPQKGEQWLSDTPFNDKAIFATNNDNPKYWFESTYDDDVYQIDTTRIKNIWYYDPNFPLKGNDYIVTFDSIPRDAIELIYKGTGENKF